MPLALFVFGVLFLVAAVRGKHKELWSVLKDDFTGRNNFFFWAGSLWIIAAIGYIKELRTLSNAFLALVVLVLLLSHRNFFEKFMEQISSTQGGGIGDVSNAFALGTPNNPGEQTHFATLEEINNMISGGH